jgi:hypothetical protein
VNVVSASAEGTHLRVLLSGGSIRIVVVANDAARQVEPELPQQRGSSKGRSERSQLWLSGWLPRAAESGADPIVRRGTLPIHRLMVDRVPPDLTAPQARFAREHDAKPGVRATPDERCVYMYREEAGSSWRWLVAPDGEVLETAVFATVSR